MSLWSAFSFSWTRIASYQKTSLSLSLPPAMKLNFVHANVAGAVSRTMRWTAKRQRRWREQLLAPDLEDSLEWLLERDMPPLEETAEQGLESILARLRRRRACG